MDSLANLVTDKEELNKKEPKELKIESDSQKTINDKYIAEGNVSLNIGSAVLYADKLVYDQLESIFYIEGNIKFVQGDQFFEATKLVYEKDEDKGFVENIYGIMDFESFDSDLDIKNIDVEKREDYQNNQEGIKKINVIRPSKLGFSRNEKKTSFSLFTQYNSMEI